MTQMKSSVTWRPDLAVPFPATPLLRLYSRGNWNRSLSIMTLGSTLSSELDGNGKDALPMLTSIAAS